MFTTFYANVRTSIKCYLKQTIVFKDTNGGIANKTKEGCMEYRFIDSELPLRLQVHHKVYDLYFHPLIRDCCFC